MKSIRKVEEVIRAINEDNFDILIDLFNLPNPKISYLTLGENYKTDTNEAIEILDLHNGKIPPSIKKKASKDVDDDVDESALHFGTHMHALLEILDLKNPNFEFVKENKEKRMLKKVTDILSSLNIKDASIYKEYQFEDDVNSIKGVIDLLLVFENKCIVIDYKLKNIDDIEYNKQLGAYKKYIKESFKVDDVKTYLLSIVDAKLEEINVD